MNRIIGPIGVALLALTGCTPNYPAYRDGTPIHRGDPGGPSYASPDTPEQAAAEKRGDREAVEKMHAVKTSFNQNEFLGCQSIIRVERGEYAPGDRFMLKVDLYGKTYPDDALAPEFRLVAVLKGANAVYLLPDQRISHTDTVDRTTSEKIGRVLTGRWADGPSVSTRVETIETAELYRCPDTAMLVKP